MTTEDNAAPSGLTDECAEAWNEYRRKCCEQRDELPDIADFFAGWDAALLATAPKAAEQAPVAASSGVITAAEAVIRADRDQVLTTGHINALENAIAIQRGTLQAPVADVARGEPVRMLGYVPTDGPIAEWQYTLQNALVREYDRCAAIHQASGQWDSNYMKIIGDHIAQFPLLHAIPTQQPARASEAGETHPDDAMRGDAIARSKRILALVDDYHERPTADNRTALRHALHDAFTAASEAGEAVAWIDGKTLAGFNDAQNAHATIAVNLRRGEAAYDTDVPLYLDAPAQQAVTLTDDALDAVRYRWMRDRMMFSGSRGETVTMTFPLTLTAVHHDIHTDWHGERFDASVDATIDAALQSHSEEEAR